MNSTALIFFKLNENWSRLSPKEKQLYPNQPFSLNPEVLQLMSIKNACEVNPTNRH